MALDNFELWNNQNHILILEHFDHSEEQLEILSCCSSPLPQAFRRLRFQSLWIHLSWAIQSRELDCVVGGILVLCFKVHLCSSV